jgi:hypothetical protein
MSIEAITSVGWVGSDPTERYRNAQQHVNLDSFDPSAQGAYLSVTIPVAVESATSSLNVQNLYSAVEQGMRAGFMAPGMERLQGMLEEVGKPGSNITAGQLNAELLKSYGAMAVAGTLANISSKAVETLQTLVVKQS